MENTRDLSQFGYRELKETAGLLLLLKTNNDKTNFLGEGVSVESNPNSGNVFLVDNDFNVAMINDGKLEDFLTCPNCGNEGFKEELKENADTCCNEYLNDLKER